MVHIATAGAGLIALLTVRMEARLGGGYLVLGSFALLGFAWVEWLRGAPATFPAAGSFMNFAFSIAIIGIGVGGATWRMRAAKSARSRQAATIAQVTMPLVALIVSASLIVTRHLVDPRISVVDVIAMTVIVLAGIRQTVLVHERGRLLDVARHARTELELAILRQEVTDSRYRVLVEHVPAGVYIDVEDPEATDGGRLDYMSPQFGSILGYSPEEFKADPELWASLMHPEDHEVALAAYVDHWNSGLPLRADYRMVARDGRIVWIHDEAFAMTDAEGRRVSQGLVVDNTDQKRLEAQLLHDALHDPLTGLANRVLFRDHLERALIRAAARAWRCSSSTSMISRWSTTHWGTARAIAYSSRSRGESGPPLAPKMWLPAREATSSRSSSSVSSRWRRPPRQPSASPRTCANRSMSRAARWSSG